MQRIQPINALLTPSRRRDKGSHHPNAVIVKHSYEYEKARAIWMVNHKIIEIVGGQFG